MKRKKSFFALLMLASMMSAMGYISAQAQTREAPDWRKLHYLSEEEMKTPVRRHNLNFSESPAPTEAPRFVAEFEPMQGVTIRYPLGIPVSLVKSLAENCRVYCIVQSSSQSSARSSFMNAGVNMDQVTFVIAKSDSYWVRDYGPWYIFAGKQPAIVDNVYNRPRQNDDAIPSAFATYLGLPLYSMNLVHTGGNMMQDGRGHAVSDNLVVTENNNDEATVRKLMLDYLGIDNYHITIDPQNDYIAHVDCWGKYLAPDKILIAKLPKTDSRYENYEAVANYFATTNCCWGYPYKVYRVEEPGGSTVAPYTNSLILNKHVYVPMGSNSTYNELALQVYRDAMPGYEVEGVYNTSNSIQWLNTDALHCRTRGVMDFDMLFVDHQDVLYGTQDCTDSIAVTSKFIAYSGASLKEDSLLVYYSIDNGPYQIAHMRPTGAPDEYVGYIKGYHQASEVDYYVFGADESGHRYQQPVFGELDPHHFTVNISFTLGDVNEDGTVNIADVTRLIDYLLGDTTAPFNATAADVDSNGDINIADVTALIDLLLTE